MSNQAGNFQRAQQQGQIVNATVVSPLEPRMPVGKKLVAGKVKPILAPVYQTTVAGVNRAYYTVTLQNSITPTAFTNNYTFTYNLLPGTISDKVTRFRLNLLFNNPSGSSVNISPPNMGTQRIEISQNGNDIINTIYDTDIMIRWNIYYNKWEYDMFSSNVGLTSNWSPATAILTIPPGGYLAMTLPFVTVFDAARIHMENIKDSFLFKFYMRNLISGGAGSLSLTNASFAFDVDLDSEIYAPMIKTLYGENVLKSNYLDCMNITNTVALQSGQQTRISLQNILAKVPFLVFCIRANNNTTNNNLNNFVSLGSLTDTQQYNIQIQDGKGNDILNAGSGLGPNDIQLINAMHNDNTLFSSQNLYFINFCTNVKQAATGQQSAGFFFFDGSMYNLAINPGTSFVNGTYIVDIYAYYFRCIEVANGSVKVCNY